jgi:hypothetical protein
MTSDTRLHRLYSRARLDDREVNEFIGISHGILADGVVTPADVEYLQKWLVAHTAAIENPVVVSLLDQVDRILADGRLNSEEAAELLMVLKGFCAGDFELGELMKPSSLPLDEPPPEIVFPGSRFCFTGTFAFGTRKECVAAAHSKRST